MSQKYVYSPELLELRNIVNKVDPINLIRIGCPDDEYDGEAHEILGLIPEAKSLEQLTELIHAVFVKWFDEEMARHIVKYQKIAEQIWLMKEKIQ